MAESCLRCNTLSSALNDLRATRNFNQLDIDLLSKAVDACQRCADSSGVPQYGRAANTWRQARQQLAREITTLVNCSKWQELLRDTLDQIIETMDESLDDPYVGTRFRFDKAISRDLANYLESERGSCLDPRMSLRAQRVAQFLQTLHSNGGGAAQRQLTELIAQEALERQLDIESLPPVPQVKVAVAM